MVTRATKSLIVSLFHQKRLQYSIAFLQSVEKVLVKHFWADMKYNSCRQFTSLSLGLYDSKSISKNDLPGTTKGTPCG